MKWVQVPTVEPGPDGRTWRIVRASRDDCGLGLVDLAVGSTSDFASVPLWAWGFAAPASGRHRLAALTQIGSIEHGKRRERWPTRFVAPKCGARGWRPG